MVSKTSAVLAYNKSIEGVYVIVKMGGWCRYSRLSIEMLLHGRGNNRHGREFYHPKV